MQSYENNYSIPTDRHPLYQLAVLVLLCIGSLFLFNFLGLLAVFPFLNVSFSNLENVMSHPAAYPNLRIWFLILQGISSGGGFILAPLLLLNWQHKPIALLNTNSSLFLVPVLITVLLVFLAMPINSFVIEWNSNMSLPSFLKPIETWMLQKEEALKELTEYFTNFSSYLEFAMGFLVIAIIPAIGEELVFRGFFQNILFKWTKNGHVAIWIAAFIFSAIHLQFYGLIPRMLLGALFGYLYFWSGNIIIPMIAHFVNNGTTLLLVWLKNKNMLSFDIESTQAMPMESIIPSIILAIFLLYSFYKFYIHKKVING